MLTVVCSSIREHKKRMARFWRNRNGVSMYFHDKKTAQKQITSTNKTMNENRCLRLFPLHNDIRLSRYTSLLWQQVKCRVRRAPYFCANLCVFRRERKGWKARQVLCFCRSRSSEELAHLSRSNLLFRCDERVCTKT